MLSTRTDLNNRFRLLLSELEIGNDSNVVKNELVQIVTHFEKHGVIPAALAKEFVDSIM